MFDNLVIEGAVANTNLGVLANDLEEDGEALTLTSVTTTCAGSVSEDLGLVTLIQPEGVVEDCSIDYTVEDERGASASALVTVQDGTHIFSDGFESGDLSGGWTVGEKS